MSSANFPVLSLMVWLPIILAIFFIFSHKVYGCAIVCICSLLIFLLSFFLLLQQKGAADGWLFLEQKKLFFFNYYLGIDAVSAALVCLTSFIVMVCIVYACFIIKVSVMNITMLLLIESFATGAFLSLDLLLFYMFFEVSLIPVFIVVGMGNDSDSSSASFKMFLYTIFGSLLALLAIVYLYFGHGISSVNELQNGIATLTSNIRLCVWIAMFIAFAVKLPMLPLHMWLPNAHTNAPTIGSAALAAIMLKLGAYGMLRFIVPFFSDINKLVVNYINILSISAVIYGALAAFAQKDVKKIIAYSSISHMGFVTVGLFSGNVNAIIGAIFQMIAHGLSSAALFFCVGILKQKIHGKLLDDYGGIARIAPKLAAFFLFFTFSAIGVPGTSGFVAEFLIVLGLGRERIMIAILLAFGFVLGATYMLNLYKKVFTGNLSTSHAACGDIGKLEISLLLLLAISVLFLGVYPKFFLTLLEDYVEHKLLFIPN
ncbi:NADH-quinone oxidoreductase subunit M [Candidatus Xenohaliotis californiensis]|uniref:NADH-quinone oxidoreductase subunit M n=1 Tax=Candidatus Xenohaliotis californiensis TaxID=84677 RepID=A0ABM9N8F6_9RICK|nr:NADH-quinone oxidoreductase subunit M [Candidatus Xenohaliotis californiensis]